jgi:hypothetical protein
MTTLVVTGAAGFIGFNFVPGGPDVVDLLPSTVT